MEIGQDRTRLRTALRRFAAAVIVHAGRRGRAAAALVGAGAVLEGAGIMLLVPILATVIGRDPAATRWYAAMLPAGGGALAVLLAGFLALMAVRAVVLFRRDTLLADLQLGFVAAVRNRAIDALATAPWTRIVDLQHARVPNLLGADIGRVAQATHLLVQGAVACAMLAMQMAIAILLSPVLAAGVAAVLLTGLAVMVARVRWAHDAGSALVETHLRLLHDTTGFLGGLKAAKVEDAGPRFAADFAAVQAEMTGRQIAFVVRQARGRALFALASAAGAATVVGAGVLLSIPGAVLAALIVLFARMAGPVASLQAALQNVAFCLPSFDAIRALEADLGVAEPSSTTREPPPGDISLDAARFVHPGGGGLTSATLTIAAGEMIGLSGPSGAGKTTLVDVLTGLLEPQSALNCGPLAFERCAYKQP